MTMGSTSSEPPTDGADERWAPVNNRWGDAMRVAHLLRADNSPSCGCIYFSCSGPFQGSDKMPRCKVCVRMAASRRRPK